LLRFPWVFFLVVVAATEARRPRFSSPFCASWKISLEPRESQYRIPPRMMQKIPDPWK
jgi:hypothetical protein